MKFFKSLFVFIFTLVIYPLFFIISWFRIFFKKIFKIKPIIIWGPTPIINIAGSSALMNELGYKSKTLVYSTYFITKKFDYDLTPWLKKKIIGSCFPNFVFLWSLLFFDIYHFYYDGGLWSGVGRVKQAAWLELPLLRLAGKRIIASAYGADVRARRRNEMWQSWNLCGECPEPGIHCFSCNDFEGLKRIKYYRDWCNEILAMGDMHDYVFGSNPHFVYWPINLKEIKVIDTINEDSAIRIAHSPNHRHFKGTRFIESAVESLRKKGYKIELDIIERVNNEEAKHRYARADIIFAQCIAGWFGFTEIESMAAGKPVITYLRDPERYLSHTPNCPAVSTTPNNLEAALEELVIDSEKRKKLSIQGRKYVEDYWSFEACAKPYKDLHDKVWSSNKLFTTLVNKWWDFWRGESRVKIIHNKNNPILKEFIIWSDPFLAIKRVEWGLYGRPIYNSEGYLQASFNKNFLKHPGVIALYCMDCYHAMLASEGNEALKHKEQFLKHARWITEFIVNSKGARLSELELISEIILQGLPEVPPRVVSYRILALPVLLRAKQLEPQGRYHEAIDILFALYSKPHNEGGFLLQQDDNVYFLDANKPEDIKSVTCILISIFVLFEYYSVSKKNEESIVLNKALSTLMKFIEKKTMRNFISFDYIGCDFKTDEYYFIIKSFSALSVLTRNKFFLSFSRKLACQFYVERLIRFVKFKNPL